MKPTKDGMRSFNIGCLDDFIYEGLYTCFDLFRIFSEYFSVLSGFKWISIYLICMNFLESMIVDDILSASDKQLIIKHALDTIKAQESEKKFPGQDHAELYHGQSIIQAALYEEFIINMYSLHDKEFLKKMGPTWYKSYKHQPVDLIRNYFGESIAMYFSFVGEHHNYGHLNIIMVIKLYSRLLHVRFDGPYHFWNISIPLCWSDNSILLRVLCFVDDNVPGNLEAKKFRACVQMGNHYYD